MPQQLSDTFIVFAKSGTPSNATIPTWETYDLHPRGAERRLFAKVPFTQQGT